MADYGIFKTSDAKRIAAATRIVEGKGRKYLGVPERIANRWNLPGEATDPDEGFPAGTGGCGCNDCVKGSVLPHATQCCKGPLSWTLTNPWIACDDDVLRLEYEPNDKWITESFTAPNGNEYRFQLEPDIDGQSFLTLVLATDNDGGEVCLRYWCESFQCQCANTLTLDKPFGFFRGINKNDVSCNACIKPNALTAGIATPIALATSCVSMQGQSVALPGAWLVSVSGYSGGGWCNDDRVAATESSGECSWDARPYFDIDVNGTQLCVGAAGGANGACGFNTGLTCGALYAPPAPTGPRAGVDGSWPVGQFCTGLGVHEAAYVTAYLSVGVFDVGDRNVDIVANFTFSVLSDNGSHTTAWPSPFSRGAATYSYTLGTLNQDDNTVDDWNALFESGIDLSLCELSSNCQDPPPYEYASTVSATPSSAIDGQPPTPPFPTETGACEDDDCTPPDAPIEPSGCCCIGDAVFHFIGNDDCTSLGGTYYADCADAAESCVDERGHCCMPDGSCIGSLRNTQCAGIGGTWSAGASCSDGCTGACCHSDGTCSLETEADCNALSYSTFYGPGTDCTGRTCLGACCCDGTSCCVGQMTEDACLMNGGTAGHLTADCTDGGGVLSWVEGDDCTHCPGSC